MGVGMYRWAFVFFLELLIIANIVVAFIDGNHHGFLGWMAAGLAAMRGSASNGGGDA